MYIVNLVLLCVFVLQGYFYDVFDDLFYDWFVWECMYSIMCGFLLVDKMCVVFGSLW